MSPPQRTPTPYGGRLTWTLPGGTSLVVHLKDTNKIRNRKRWSQVMYLYYLLGYNLLAGEDQMFEGSFGMPGVADKGTGSKIRLTESQLRKRRRSAFFSRSVIFNYVSEDVQRKAENTYILTLDGDVDFRPEAVRLLLDRMKKNKKVGAACGRIHPIGSGPIVWYQQFEYAIGHWLQKATEHVFGCVMCAPGCFSLFRGSALMDDNVARMYATKSTEAGHYVQFDQGEDRWLSTLLLQQGYRIDYSAAADAYTQAPETFNEFFNQRRRWGPSTLANVLDLLGNWRSTVHINDNISSLYIFYQTMMFVSALLGPATVLLMMAGAYQVVFKISVFESYCLAIIPAAFYVTLCMFSKTSSKQLSVGAVYSAIYAIVMTVVLVGTIGTAISGSITSPNVIFMVMLSVIFITSAFMHPRELGCLVPGALYFICIPAGYLVLTIYFLTNLHVVSWGTREVPKKKTKEELEKERQQLEKKEKRKAEKKDGIIGWLGIRYIITEISDLMKQFRDLLFETSRRNESTDSVGTKAKKIKSRHQNPTVHTNELLQQLIEELKGSKAMNKGQEKSSEVHATEDFDGKCPQESIDVIYDRDNTKLNDAAEDKQTGNNLQQVIVTPTTMTSRSPTIREDPARPSWILHQAMGVGPIKLLGERERVFWTQLMAKYLYPIVDEPQQRERIHKDLLALRNNVVFAFFMTSAVWIALFMQLEILQSELKNHLFVHIPRIDGQGTLSFQPLGLIFLACFSIILLLQFVGMFAHRWGTMLHTLSITDIWIGGHLKEQDKVKDIILRVSQLQKLRNIEMEPEPDYDEPLPDYLDEEDSEHLAKADGCREEELDTNLDVPPDYDDDDVEEQGNARLGQPYNNHYSMGRSPYTLPVNPIHPAPLQQNLDGPPSVPPSYHTQEVNFNAGRRGLHPEPRRRGVFDSRGYPHAFALENAFERRFRNELMLRRQDSRDHNPELSRFPVNPVHKQLQQQQLQQTQQQPAPHDNGFRGTQFRGLY